MNVAALNQRGAWQRRTFEFGNAVEKRDAVASTADDSLNRIFQRGLTGHLHVILRFPAGSLHSVLDKGLRAFVFCLQVMRGKLLRGDGLPSAAHVRLGLR
jgi:hypothetical protein